MRGKPLCRLFPRQMQFRSEGKCPLCTKRIAWDEFRDEPSRKEFRISGLCQKCQDEVFGE